MCNNQKIWVRMRSEGEYAVLEAQYGDDEYVELAREWLGSKFCHESRVWPEADRSGVKP